MGNDEPSQEISLSIHNLEEFDSRSYQTLLSNMVSVMRAEALDGYERLDEEPPGSQSRLLETTGFSKGLLNRKKSEMQVRMHLAKSRFAQNIPTPSRFSITSVDPLHFLGITPLVRSGELLHACELPCPSLLSSRHAENF